MATLSNQWVLILSVFTNKWLHLRTSRRSLPLIRRMINVQILSAQFRMMDDQLCCFVIGHSSKYLLSNCVL